MIVIYTIAAHTIHPSVTEKYIKCVCVRERDSVCVCVCEVQILALWVGVVLKKENVQQNVVEVETAIHR